MKIVKEHINIIEEIKSFLINENDKNTWKDFINSQEMGDCQSIVRDIIKKFPIAKKVFGELKLNNKVYNSEEDSYTKRFTHHWVSINNNWYDFSKGTLKYYLDELDMVEADMYEPEIFDKTHYKKLYQENINEGIKIATSKIKQIPGFENSTKGYFGVKMAHKMNVIDYAYDKQHDIYYILLMAIRANHKYYEIYSYRLKYGGGHELDNKNVFLHLSDARKYFNEKYKIYEGINLAPSKLSQIPRLIDELKNDYPKSYNKISVIEYTYNKKYKKYIIIMDRHAFDSYEPYGVYTYYYNTSLFNPEERTLYLQTTHKNLEDAKKSYNKFNANKFIEESIKLAPSKISQIPGLDNYLYNNPKINPKNYNLLEYYHFKDTNEYLLLFYSYEDSEYQIYIYSINNGKVSNDYIDNNSNKDMIKRSFYKFIKTHS